MHNNQPYQNQMLDLVIQGYMRKRSDIVFSDAKHAFKKVAVVGMLLPDLQSIREGRVHPDDLWRDDIDMLGKTLSQFSQAGIPTSNDVTFDIYNLLPPVQSDFLNHADMFADISETSIGVDLVSINYVHANGSIPGDRFYNTHRGFEVLSHSTFCDTIDASDRLTSASRLSRSDNIWPSATFNTGASFVATHGGAQDEVNTTHFEGHDKSVILTSTKDAEAHKRENRTSGKPMGVIANRENLARYARHAQPQNPLGQAMILKGLN